MKILNIFQKNRAKRSGAFSDFFYNATIEEKKKIVERAAKKANEDQRTLLRRADSECSSK